MKQQFIILVLSLLLVLVKSVPCDTPPSNCNETSNHPLYVDIINRVRAYLPEGIFPPKELIKPVPLLTFTNDYIIQIMFLQNNGTFKNQLGYFTVSTSQPDKIVEHKLVFLSTAKDCLNTGDFVKLGPFLSNIMIGFYIVSNGWCGGTDILYTLNTFNNDSTILTTTFFDSVTGGTLVIGMEDMIGKEGDDYQDVVFAIDTIPPLNPSDFKGDIPLVCKENCADYCNFTTGNCISQRNYGRNSRIGVILSITFGLAFFLIIAIAIIIYLIRMKSVGRGVLPEGWYPVPNSLADQLQIDDNKEEELDDEENL